MINQQQYFPSVDESQRNGIGSIYSSHPAKDPHTLISFIDNFHKCRKEIPIRLFGTDRRPKRIEQCSYWRYPSIEMAREIYSRSMVWILPSKSEGFPAPPLEAMACGCCVVATDCGGTRDIINDGENGFLVDVGNVEQIIDRTLLLLDNKKLRENICLKAKKTVKKFTWDECIEKLENVLTKLV